MAIHERGPTNHESESQLTVEAICVLRASPDASPVHAATYLDALSEAEWADLRADASRSGKTGNPLLRCGDCRNAVYARESPRRRRHCYHFAGDHRDCRWSGAVAGNLSSIDADKSQGQQEGEEHKSLCRLVKEVLELDSSTGEAGISFKKYTKNSDGQYAFPDVFAERWQGGPAAFEIQLSTTHLPVILRREKFYQQAGIRLIWIVGYHGEDLYRRAFRDIYMRNDGQILGIDGDVVVSAREAGEPRFRLYRLVPGAAQEGFAPMLRDRIVAPSEINWGQAGDRPRSARRSYDSYLSEKVETDPILQALRRDFYDALKDADEARARITWDTAADTVGGRRWDDLPSSYDTVRALGVLASLRTETLCVRSQIPLTNLPHLVNTMLLEPTERRCWTHAFELLCRAKGLEELLSRPSIREKCERNRNGGSSSPPIDRTAGAVFNVFFPEGAFYRLDL